MFSPVIVDVHRSYELYLADPKNHPEEKSQEILSWSRCFESAICERSSSSMLTSDSLAESMLEAITSPGIALGIG